MTYVAEYFHAFSSLGKYILSKRWWGCIPNFGVTDKVETAGRRIAKLADVLNSIWQMQHDYEHRARTVS